MELRGADVVARAAMASSQRARYSAPALVEGAAGIVMAPHGQLFLVLSFAFDGDRRMWLQRLTGLEVWERVQDQWRRRLHLGHDVV